MYVCFQCFTSRELVERGVPCESQFNFFFQAYSTVREQTEMFRLGVQKCKKIIYDCIPPDPDLFKCEGIEVLFNILNKVHENREIPPHEKVEEQP